MIAPSAAGESPGAAETPAIDIRGVTRRFLTPEGRFNTAMRDFSLRVERGEFVCIVGPTGCGKSTTLNLVTGLIRPSAGEVRVAGEPVAGIDPGVGFVFQSDALFPWKSVLANVAAGPRYRGVPKDEALARARAWIARVGLADYETLYPHQLSGGMRKRVALARALVLDPELLFLDEPTSGLDPISARAFDSLIRLLADNLGLTVFLVTHDLDTLFSIIDRVIVLSDGRVLGSGTVAELKQFDDPWLNDYFAARAPQKETTDGN